MVQIRVLVRMEINVFILLCEGSKSLLLTWDDSMSSSIYMSLNSKSFWLFLSEFRLLQELQASSLQRSFAFSKNCSWSKSESFSELDWPVRCLYWEVLVGDFYLVRYWSKLWSLSVSEGGRLTEPGEGSLSGSESWRECQSPEVKLICLNLW